MSAYLLNHQGFYKRHSHQYFLQKALTRAGASPAEWDLFHFLLTAHYQFQGTDYFDLRACTSILFRFPPIFQTLLLLNLYRYEMEVIHSKDGVTSKAPTLVQRAQLLSSITQNPWGPRYLRLFSQPLGADNHSILSEWWGMGIEPVQSEDVGLLIKLTFDQLEYYEDYSFLTHLAQTNDTYASASYLVEALGYSTPCKQEILGTIQQWPSPTDISMLSL